ncbi:WD40-repeat-containing domain protein [Gautieria morchelliformis]|nr:WD40-repeat-containing domain protein [Gautieria morchelliformis]
MTQAESLYISASTNRHPHAADVSSSLICFASHKLITLWDTSDPSDSGVFVALPGHLAEVNCVKFMQNGNIIASGDQKGVLQIRMKKSTKWKIVIDQPAHPRPIASLVTHGNFVATGASDATVKLWRFTTDGEKKGSLDLVQSLDLNGRYPLDIQLTAFPGTSCLILAVASTGREIKIYTGTESQLVYSASLSGHEDWVKCLAFTQSRRSPPQLTLASGSQDGIIRLWTLDHITSPHPHQPGDDIIDAFEASLADFSEEEEGGRQMSTKHHVIVVKSLSGSLHHFSLVLDALLVSHEAGITSLSWRPQRSDCQEPPTLLSTSVDSSLILWSPSSLPSPSVDQDSTPLWISQQRFGDVGGQRFGGFVGGIWADNDNGCEVLGWGWGGGWRRWRCLTVPEGHAETWEEAGAVTGHQGAVRSIAWAPCGDYLLSTGLDQTSRIHGPYRRPSSDRESWHELARPQVHGYDIVGAEFMSSLRFVSIADEKVARVFDAPKSFVATVNSLGTVRVPFSMESRPAGANVPPLGLSNKATTDERQGFGASVGIRYPFESELASATLWPEIEKIFGHGYELISVTTSHSSSLFATACKSTTAEHAGIRVYNADDWQLVGEPLGGHTLTVTRIAFSPNDKMILSVSRDRTWRLFRAQNNGYFPIATDRSHGRIIWDCAWMVEGSEVAFATASRDKTVKFWQPADESLFKWTAVATLKFKEAVTAIDFSPVLCDGRRRLAVGLESGEIFIYSSQPNAANGWTRELSLESQLAHVDSVHRILWRPSKDKGLTQQLATCSEDRTIRVMIVHLGFH